MMWNERKKIRVMFIFSWYPNKTHSTLGNFVQKHAEAVALFADVSVLHVCFDDTLKDKKNEIVWIKDTTVKTLYIYCRKSFNPVHNFFRYLKAYRKGLKILIKQYGQPDIIHANVLIPVGLIFYFCKAYKKIPYVITEHWTSYLPEDPSKINFVMKYFLSRVVCKAAFMLPVSDDLRNAMIEQGFKCKYKVIPNVVDTALFVPSEKKANSIKKILHVSSLDDSQKNASGILSVIKKLSEKRIDFALHIISDGEQKLFITAAQEMNILDKYVFFHGPKKTDEIAGMMQQSDFLLLFSNYENLPCVITEAYSCGLPVVSTDVGGISEHLTEKHGILVPAKNEQTLLTAIDTMLNNLDNYDKNFLHDYAEKNFSYQSVGKQYIEVYKKVLNSYTIA